MLHPIDKGQLGWKKRKLEILILDVVSNSTVPQTGWRVFQKLRKKMSVDGDDICVKMNNLCERGYLERVGFEDESSKYILTD